MAYWTSTPSYLGNWFNARELGVYSTGAVSNNYSWNGYGVRPVIYLASETLTEILKQAKTIDGITYVQLWEYPKSRACAKLEKILEQGTDLGETGKMYKSISTNFEKSSIVEYDYEGKKYCKVDGVWHLVEPVEWIYLEKNGVLISKDVLLGNVPVDKRRNFIGLFNGSQMYNWLNTAFIKDLIPSEVKEKDFETEEISEEDLQAEFKRIQSKNKSREEKIKKLKLERIAELQRMIEEERQRGEELDRQLEALQKPLSGGEYVRK